MCTDCPIGTRPIVERRFSQLNLVPGQEPQPPRTLTTFFDREAFVVLGDPGAGKTTCFRQAAQEELNATFTTVRDFLTFRADRFQGHTLYLDALDEMRGRTEDGSTVLDRVRSRLDDLGCPRFRLSCRAADWYGRSDAARLADVSPDRTLAILVIEPLGEAEITRIISSRGISPQGFITAARDRGIYKLLENPQTLLMLLEVVGQGQWPETRAELFKRTTEIMVREVNEEHRRTQRANVTTQDLLEAAGYLSAVVLCGGAEGIALDEGAAGNGFLPIRAIGGAIDPLLEVARRRLFCSQGVERVVPVHRMVVEYLAGKYFCDRIREGLPLKRVLSLITGHDGGTLSDLRGIFAWLACVCLEHFDSLIPVDPLGVVLYGDVSLLPAPEKKQPN